MAKLARNSVWYVNEVFLELDEGVYRLLDVDPVSNWIIIFRIYETNKIKRPFVFDLNSFYVGISERKIEKHDYGVPPVMRLSEDEIKDAWKKKRDKKYQIIAPLVEDEKFLWLLAINKKSEKIRMRADEIHKSVNSLYRMLRDYWKYGQNRNSLMPLYVNSGAPGVQKNTTSKIRGRPKQQPIFNFKERKSKNVTKIDKRQMRAAVNKYLIKGNVDNVSSVYEKYLKDYHKEEVVQAKKENRSPNVPSINQFRYWQKKNGDVVKDGKAMKGDVAWEMNHRGLLGSVRDQVVAPGDRYEIDATVADVYVVSEFNRSVVLGRPVIYVIVDTASRMVAGLYVDLKYASWDAAKQALLNAFLPKTEYCARYGISITEDDWPCHYLPRALMCDRGEMIGLKPETHLTPMGLVLEFAAATRADWKSVVERRFGIANDEVIHELSGTTKGKPRTRMDPDPKIEAIHTLTELTSILIEGFIEFNKTRFLEDLIVPGLVSKDLEPTPLNYWNYFVSQHLDALSVVDIEQARAELLPAARARITARGIKVDDIYYSCVEAEEDNWFARARANGEWSIDARIDESNTSEIYVRKDIRSPLVKCNILPRERLYANQYKADIIWLSEWKREKKETGSDLWGKVRQAERVDELRKEAIDDRKETYGSFKKVPNKTKDLKNARAEEVRLKAEVERKYNLSEGKHDAASVVGGSSISKFSLIERVLDDAE